MNTIDKTKPVLVTGANGYLASWIVKYLLEQGTPVHGTVRNLSDKSKYKHLLEIAEASQSELKIFEADLVNEGSFSEAMQGCSIVFHAASPFFISKIKDPIEQLIKPAENGTANVLHQAINTKSVKRIVLTSSAVAIQGDAKDVELVENGIFDETIWNTTSSAKHQPYAYSKTLAEKKAWEMAGTQGKWDLIVMNPSFILGPSLNKNPGGTSTSVMIQFGNGDLKMGAPDFWYGFVDVRDAAKAHLLGAYKKESSGRHILCSEHGGFLKMADILREKYQNKFPLPKKMLPKGLFWLMGPMFGIKRAMIAKNVGYRYTLNNQYSIDDLGIEYRPLKETILDHFEQIIADGMLK